MSAQETLSPGLVGDGYDVEPLLTAEDVSVILRIPVKSVYTLPIPKVKLGRRTVRYCPASIRTFIERRTVEIE